MKRIDNIWFCLALILTSLPLAHLKGQADTVCLNDTILYETPKTPNATYYWNIIGGTIIHSSDKGDSVIVVWNKNEVKHSLEVSKQSDNLCMSQPWIIDVFVHAPTIDLGEDLIVCEGHGKTIEADPAYLQYLWNNEPGTNEYTVHSAGSLLLEVKDKYGCWAKDSIMITENKNPIPDFLAEIDTMNKSVTLLNLSDSQWQYHWNFGDETESNLYNPRLHEYADTGTYEISLFSQYNGCSGDIQKTVSIPAYLISDFDAIYQGCAPVEVSFINHSKGADSYHWNFGNGATSSNENTKVVYKNPGIYKVSLNARQNNAQKTSTKTLIINPPPIADFEFVPTEPVIYQDIHFLNNSVNANRYLWDFGDDQTSEMYDPTHSFSSMGEYDILLQVWSENGCYDSILINNAVSVSEDCDLIFPSGFIPDKEGPSGGHYDPVVQEINNNIFHPLYRNIDEYELKIYNRWGELVFVSQDINIGWDGYHKGKLSSQDTYLYTVKSKCIFGKEISKTGSVTLIY